MKALSPRLLIAVALSCATSHALADEAKHDEVVAPPVACVGDPASAKDEVAAAFAELQTIHRNRVPGPAGQHMLDARVNALLERLVGFEVFVDIALGDAWRKADDDQKKTWRGALEDTLRQRYLKKLGSPLTSRIEFKQVQLRCDRAEVALVVHDHADRTQDVVLELYATRVPEGLRWRAFDVSVDGVSLLETWKGRFHRLYVDGGLAAIDQHMRTLRERYPPR